MSRSRASARSCRCRAYLRCSSRSSAGLWAGRAGPESAGVGRSAGTRYSLCCLHYSFERPRPSKPLSRPASRLFASSAARLTEIGREDDYERDYESVEDLGRQRSTRLTEELGKELLDSLVPGRVRHEPQSGGCQLREFVQDYGAQRSLLLAASHLMSVGIRQDPRGSRFLRRGKGRGDAPRLLL